MNLPAPRLAITCIAAFAPLSPAATLADVNAPDPGLAAGVTSDDETLVAKIRDFIAANNVQGRNAVHSFNCPIIRRLGLD